MSIDATGVGTKIFDRWPSHSTDRLKDFVELRTALDDRGAAFSIAITDGVNSEVILFPYLLNDLDAPVGIVRADNRYLSRDNVRFVEDTAAVTYIKPKLCSRMRSKGEFVWRHNALQVPAGPAVVPEGVPPA